MSAVKRNVDTLKPKRQKRCTAYRKVIRTIGKEKEEEEEAEVLRRRETE